MNEQPLELLKAGLENLRLTLEATILGPHSVQPSDLIAAGYVSGFIGNELARLESISEAQAVEINAVMQGMLNQLRGYNDGNS